MHFQAAQLFITMELLEWNGIVLLTLDRNIDQVWRGLHKAG